MLLCNHIYNNNVIIIMLLCNDILIQFYYNYIGIYCNAIIY